MEIKDIRKFNMEYTQEDDVIWREIGAPPLQKKKNYSNIRLTKLKLEENVPVDEELKEQIYSEYIKCGEMIPVLISRTYKLLIGYEQYSLAKELGLRTIPMIMKKGYNQEDRYATKRVGNRKYPVRTTGGTTLYVSLNHQKKIFETSRLVQRICMTTKTTLRIKHLKSKFCKSKSRHINSILLRKERLLIKNF